MPALRRTGWLKCVSLLANKFERFRHRQNSTFRLSNPLTSDCLLLQAVPLSQAAVTAVIVVFGNGAQNFNLN